MREEEQQHPDNKQTPWAASAAKEKTWKLPLLLLRLLNCISMAPIHETIYFYCIQIWALKLQLLQFQSDEFKLNSMSSHCQTRLRRAAAQKQAHDVPATCGCLLVAVFWIKRQTMGSDYFSNYLVSNKYRSHQSFWCHCQVTQTSSGKDESLLPKGMDLSLTNTKK